MGRAATIVGNRGKLYVTKKKYTLLIVFSTLRGESDLLQFAFGGKVYKHRSGFYWTLARFKDLRQMYDILGEFPEVQMKLKELLELSGRPWDEVDVEELRRREA